MQQWPRQVLLLLDLGLVLTTGCTALTDLPSSRAPASHPPASYPKEAYESAPPRKPAYVAECTRLGGRVIDRACYTEGAGGSVLIHVPESFDGD